MLLFSKLISEQILLESTIDLFFESIKRNHGSQYKGKIDRRFHNVLQGTLQNTNIYFSSHFTDQIQERIYSNADLTYKELQEFNTLFKSRIQKVLKEINKRFSFLELVDKEHCFLIWFPKTKDSFIVCLDKDFKDTTKNCLVFTTLLPRKTDNTKPTTRSNDDIFIEIQE